MNDPILNRANLPRMLSQHALAWRRAVQLQADRARESSSVVDGHADAYLLAMAIRQVLRAAEAMAEAIGHADDQLDYVRRQFLHAHPDAKDARDVLEHFDCLLSRAREGFRSPGKLGGLEISVERGEDRLWLVLSEGLRVELAAVSEAVLELASVTREPEMRFHSVVVPEMVMPSLWPED